MVRPDLAHRWYFLARRDRLITDQQLGLQRQGWRAAASEGMPVNASRRTSAAGSLVVPMARMSSTACTTA